MVKRGSSEAGAMDAIEAVANKLVADHPRECFVVYERRPGKWHLLVPFYHADADPVDVYLTQSPNGCGWVRICDFGLAIMRTSFTHDIEDVDMMRRMYERIRSEWGVESADGALYIDVRFADLYESVMRFSLCAQFAHVAWNVDKR